MKNLIPVILIFVGVKTLASDIDDLELKRLAGIMGNKTMICESTTISKPTNDGYQGDEGFFKLRIKNNELQVFDNGGMGFGFANGGVRDLHVGDEDLFLSVGDDGYQILTLHVADFGSENPDCAEGRLISYWDGFHSGGDQQDAVKCCLK